eukprot:3866860-Amphidinium_carterae.1
MQCIQAVSFASGLLKVPDHLLGGQPSVLSHGGRPRLYHLAADGQYISVDGAAQQHVKEIVPRLHAQNPLAETMEHTSLSDLHVPSWSIA